MMVAVSRHGHTKPNRTRTYIAWGNMLQRVTNPRFPQWKDYGGRGITVCERWRTFDAFLQDMGECPDGLTLDRIDSAGNYESGNCRWATRKEQQRWNVPKQFCARGHDKNIVGRRPGGACQQCRRESRRS